MKVREILEAKGSRVVTIRPDATLSAAVHRLALERIGALVVSDDGCASPASSPSATSSPAWRATAPTCSRPGGAWPT
jgi:hypothetical protein